MSSWSVPTFAATVAGVRLSAMALFKSVNSPIVVTFTLTAVPARGATLRIATTAAFAGGRPAISIGGFTSPASASPAPADLNSRIVTRGTWRGLNQTYHVRHPGQRAAHRYEQPHRLRHQRKRRHGLPQPQLRRRRAGPRPGLTPRPYVSVPGGSRTTTVDTPVARRRERSSAVGPVAYGEVC